MARLLRLKISRIFQSCQSKDTSDIIPTYHVNHLSTFKPSHKKHKKTIKSHVSSALVGCGLKAQEYLTASDDDDDDDKYYYTSPIETPMIQWDKEEKWHAVEMTPPNNITPPTPPPTAEKKKKTRKKRRAKYRKGVSRILVSTSSADSVMFSSERIVDIGKENEETETLVSSNSFSTDASRELNLGNMTITEMPVNMRRKRKVKSRVKSRRSVSSTRMTCRSPPENASPARLSVFQRMIPCTVEGKMRESFAVVKKSEDPYKDFKKSMMEMIMEKKMFDEKDLVQLLHCFLSLNSKNHHAVIVKAFSEIWEVLFSRRAF